MTKFLTQQERLDIQIKAKKIRRAIGDMTTVGELADFIQKVVGDPSLFRSVSEHVAHACLTGSFSAGQLATVLAGCHASNVNVPGKWFAKVGMRMVNGSAAYVERRETA